MKARILIVDDDDAGRITLDALLDEEGFSVVTAASSAELDGVLATEACFDAALVDYHLDGELGTELIPSIRAHSPFASVAMVTGSEPARVEPPVDGWLVKGAGSAHIVAEVTRLAAAALHRAETK